MIKKINNDTRGQTALILILLTAAALIFLAITLNWGRVAQTKALLTIAADQSASLLASDVASYGEMQKQENLKGGNQYTGSTGLIVYIALVILAIVCTVIAICTYGAGAPLALLSYAALAAAIVGLFLQLVVVQPTITSLWNSLQKNQPVDQQFFEGGIVAALEGSVTDQVNITDYFDSNANGIFGRSTNNFPNDTVGRFALFYTDRLKMLNKPPIPQVIFFYDQLGELMNGETCDQNESDHATYQNAVTLNPACAKLNSSPTYCVNDPIDPACQAKIPGIFQLNDACPGSNPNNTATYSPYCDPCCQPLTVSDPAYCAPGSTNCTFNPMHPSSNVSVRPSNCDQSTSPPQCLTNNPYGVQYTLLYDPTFQNYAAGVSFLAQYGRDQQMGPQGTPTPAFTLTPDVITPAGVTPIVEFPNGIFPFFWLMKDYSPEVDNINPNSLQSLQVHWCAAGGSIPSLGTAYPTGFSDLAQLSLPYSCQGQDCCVNYLAGTVANGVPIPSSTIVNGVIDIVGSVGSPKNPALDPSFGEGSSGSWLQGDNQMCSTTWPYNGANSGFPDGTCEWTGSAASPTTSSTNTLVEPPSTLDALDYTLHSLSDFVNFSNGFLNNDVGTLSSTFTSWYPQAAFWIDPSTGRLPLLETNLSNWNTMMTNWLNTIYTSNSAWCVPQEATLLSENGSNEDAYIKSNDSGATWGSLPSVIACLNYNASTTPANNYQQCLTALAGEKSTCSALPAKCAPLTLGRSLAGAAPVFTAGDSSSCDPAAAGSYAQWVSNSYTLATDEAPKFTLRSKFLADVYSRAQYMPALFQSGYKAISAFLKPCSGSNCSAGGPAAQLTYAYNQSSPTSELPNSVIYGWVDNPYSNGQPGYAHLVKVTAYSPGRGAKSGTTLKGITVNSLLPWPQTETALGCSDNPFAIVYVVSPVGLAGYALSCDLARTYTLEARDGEVYVSVKRWDEDHSNSVLFPNGHPLWQFLFHNPTAGSLANTTGKGLMQVCNGLTVTGGSGGPIGFGLGPLTVKGLGYAGISSQDQTALANAFMLNDEGTGTQEGTVDPYAKLNNSGYLSCLSQANALLDNAPESHMCAKYIAGSDASKPSGETSNQTNYSLKFVSCQEQPEDLTYNTSQL